MSAALNITDETKIKLNYTAPSYAVVRFLAIFIGKVAHRKTTIGQCVVLDLSQPLSALDQTWIGLLTRIMDGRLADAGVETQFDYGRKDGQIVAMRLYIKKLAGTRLKPDLLVSAFDAVMADLDKVETALKANNINTEPPIFTDKYLTDL